MPPWPSTSCRPSWGCPRPSADSFAGTLQAYQQSLATEPILVTTALLAVYIVLGILYESLVHPLTIISTLPPASVGAMLALLLFHNDLNVISIIGIVLLDRPGEKERHHDDRLRAGGRAGTRQEHDRCHLRSLHAALPAYYDDHLAALFGAVPLAFGTGTGSELRRPLGITIVGGLIVSQMLTLYTTPVIYLYMDRLRLRAHGQTSRHFPGQP